MKDLIILSGGPGSGKSTIGELLREKEGYPLIEFGWLRQGHLNNAWSDASPKEKEMAWENLIFILKNYWQHGYKNIIVTDLEDDQVVSLVERFKEKECIIISLILSDDAELKKRVSGKRDSGFKNVEASLEQNRNLKSRPLLLHEFKTDNSQNDPMKTVEKIMDLLKK